MQEARPVPRDETKKIKGSKGAGAIAYPAAAVITTRAVSFILASFAYTSGRSLSSTFSSFHCLSSRASLASSVSSWMWGFSSRVPTSLDTSGTTASLLDWSREAVGDFASMGTSSRSIVRILCTCRSTASSASSRTVTTGTSLAEALCWSPLLFFVTYCRFRKLRC